MCFTLFTEAVETLTSTVSSLTKSLERAEMEVFAAKGQAKDGEKERDAAKNRISALLSAVSALRRRLDLKDAFIASLQQRTTALEEGERDGEEGSPAVPLAAVPVGEAVEGIGDLDLFALRARAEDLEERVDILQREKEALLQAAKSSAKREKELEKEREQKLWGSASLPTDGRGSGKTVSFAPETTAKGTPSGRSPSPQLRQQQPFSSASKRGDREHKAQIDSLTTEVAALQCRLSAEETEAEVKRKEYEEKIESLERECESLRSERDFLKSDIDKFRGRVTEEVCPAFVVLIVPSRRSCL